MWPAAKRAPWFLAVIGVAVIGLSGCTEVRGRKTIQEANDLYRANKYLEAVAVFEKAESMVPHLPTLWINKGYACRQLIVPGSKKPDAVKAADCALAAFKRFQELKPADERGPSLYIQTLFEAGRFEELVKVFQLRVDKNPKDIEAISTLQQIFAKWEKFDEALEWAKKAAEVQPDNAEKQYAVGTFIWQHLYRHGGGPIQGSFDPRPKEKNQVPVPPQPSPGDIVSQQRLDLADLGIQYLEKAVKLRPAYSDAMAYANLLYRQKAIGSFDDLPEWQKCTDMADEWKKKAEELMKVAAPEPSASPSPSPAKAEKQGH